jgi:hypothetical protein
MVRAMSPGLDAREHAVLIAEDRDHERLALRVAGHGGGDHIESAAVGQAEIHQQHIRGHGIAVEPVQRLAHGARAAQPLQPRAAPHARLEKGSGMGVVLHDQDAPGRGQRRGRFGAGHGLEHKSSNS